MARVALFNVGMGFLLIFFAACAGAFVSFDMTNAFLRDPTLLDSWQLTLLRSAHGHVNLFGILHVLFGLTMNYSRIPVRYKYAQTYGLLLGGFAMGPLMMVKALSGPQESFDILGICIGFCLSLSLLSIGSHSAVIFYRLMRRL